MSWPHNAYSTLVQAMEDTQRRAAESELRCEQQRQLALRLRPLVAPDADSRLPAARGRAALILAAAMAWLLRVGQPDEADR
jgi:hypothetical protein